jgi:hypothetical protein
MVKHRCRGAENIKDDPAFQCAAMKCMMAYLDIQKQRKQGLSQTMSRCQKKTEKRKVSRAAARKGSSRQVECESPCNTIRFPRWKCEEMSGKATIFILSLVWQCR